MSSTVAPIQINLTGEFTIPADGQPPVAGSVSGDLRLAVLDSFLNSLSNPLAVGQSGEQQLAKAVSKILAKCDGKTLSKNDVVLEVHSTSDPSGHSISHTFKFTLIPKAFDA